MVMRLCLIACGVLATTVSTVAQDKPAMAPTVEDRTVLSLKRTRLNDSVVTELWLIATSVLDRPIEFKHTQPPKGQVKCDDQPPSRGRTLRCTYQPYAYAEGPDEFQYQAAHGGHWSQPATVRIHIHDEQYRAAVATVRTSALAGGEAAGVLPTLAGGNSQDQFVSLVLPLARPRSSVTLPDRLQRTSPPDTSSADEPIPPDEIQNLEFNLDGGSRLSRSANLVLRGGWSSEPARTAVVDRGKAPDAEDDTPSGSSVIALPRRELSLGAEFNLNGVAKSDGRGSFVEFGALFRGGFHFGLGERDDLTVREGRILEIQELNVRAGRFEVATRVALKHYREGQQHTMVLDRRQESQIQVYRPTAVDDLLVVEIGVARDGRLKGLLTAGDIRAQFQGAVRVTLLAPQVLSLPGQRRLRLGLELARAMGGGPYSLRLQYGFNLPFAGSPF